MKRSPLRDVVVVIPGITGSVLQRDGKDVWAASGSAALGWILSRGKSLSDLRLPDDGGIEATRVMRDIQIIPGLHKVDGYSAMFRMVEENFDVVRSAGDDPLLSNLIEFPYDWRQDNRDSAKRLGDLVDDRLDRWKAHSGAADAKVIILAHSMGGLVSRYWLECLGGRSKCRALITFGTPHRGSLDSLNYLANGYKKLFLDLGEVMRTFPSVHQLLPIYKALSIDGELQRVAETQAGVVPGVDHALAADALRFHREIEGAVKKNREEGGPEETTYALLPIVGTRQPTLQSAVLTGKRLEAKPDLPQGIDSSLDGGDGTVPRVSATPIELSNQWLETFRPERHSSLQANNTVLEDIAERIRGMQAHGLEEVRSAKPVGGKQPSLSVDLDDAYEHGEEVKIRAELVDVEVPLGSLQASIEPADGGAEPRLEDFDKVDGRWELSLELPPGLYRAEVSLAGGGPWRPPPVHDVFQVLPETAA